MAAALQRFVRVAASLNVATVWGIRLAVHPSWLLVFALVTWSLAAGYFPSEYPQWSVLAYWGVGAVTSLLLFGSIVIHELGHSWVALRHGLPIRSITLFVFGGVAQIGREPSSPAAELRIGAAGPITSLALALVFGAVAVLARPLEMVAAAAQWLMRINVAVAVFNLLPGFPLDGGRIVRALAWKWTGNALTATRTAAGAGRLVAAGLMTLGIVSVLRGNLLGGVWITLIGWFLQSAAITSRADADIQQLLRGVSVARAMTRECPRVRRDVTLQRLVEDEVLGAGRRCFLVTDDGRLSGLLTLHEVKSVPRERWRELTVEQVMTPVGKLTMVGPAESVLTALQKMDDANVAQLPVVEGEVLVGLIGREHVLHYIRTRAELGM